MWDKARLNEAYEKIREAASKGEMEVLVESGDIEEPEARKLRSEGYRVFFNMVLYQWNILWEEVEE